jgi:predicted RNA methylase
MGDGDRAGAYGRRFAKGYRRGRTLTEAAMVGWAEAIERRVPRPTKLVVDLGAGTGRFSRLLAERLACDVIAVEPSVDMVAETDPAVGVHWTRGRPNVST